MVLCRKLAIRLNSLKEKNGSVQSVTSVQSDEFRLVNVGSAVTVNLKNGVQVNLKAHWWILEIWVPKRFKNSVKGLCGNYNDDRSDDFVSRDGQQYNSATTAFKESWILDGTNCDPTDPELPKCNEQTVARECAKLLGVAFRRIFNAWPIITKQKCHELYSIVYSVPWFQSLKKTKMVTYLSAMTSSIPNHIMRTACLIFVKVVRIQHAVFSICTFQRVHLIPEKRIVTGQKN